MLLSIVIPTFRRPESLAGLLDELERQMRPLQESVELIVVDNCPKQSAADVVHGHAAQPRYVAEMRPGIAHARNTGLRAARGKYVIFIDDDQRPQHRWLSHYLDMALGGNEVCFGPVLPEFERPAPDELHAVVSALFTRDLGLKTGADVTQLRAYLGTGNSMFDRLRCFPQDDPFDPRFNHGGEDVWLLRQLAADHGLRFSWCAEAAVREIVPAARMTVEYVRKRRFRNGQLRCIVEAGGRRWGAILVWMIVGLGQTFVYGGASLVLLPFNGRGSAALVAKSFGGLGKILWWLPFRP